MVTSCFPFSRSLACDQNLGFCSFKTRLPKNSIVWFQVLSKSIFSLDLVFFGGIQIAQMSIKSWFHSYPRSSLSHLLIMNLNHKNPVPKKEENMQYFWDGIMDEFGKHIDSKVYVMKAWRCQWSLKPFVFFA